MTEDKAETKILGTVEASFASVSWCVDDIKELRPDWSDDECHTFLTNYEGRIQDAMVSAGWEAIDVLLGDNEDEDEKGD